MSGGSLDAGSAHDACLADTSLETAGYLVEGDAGEAHTIHMMCFKQSCSCSWTDRKALCRLHSNLKLLHGLDAGMPNPFGYELQVQIYQAVIGLHIC